MAGTRKYTNKLASSNILIIGGTSGIGFCVAEACLEHGAIVHVASSRSSRVDYALERLLKDYPDAKDRLFGHTCDIGPDDTMEANLLELLKKIASEAPLNHIVFTAGDKLQPVPLQQASIADMKAKGNTRFFGALMLGKLAPQFMAGGKSSSITVSGGMISERPGPNLSIMTAFAAGMEGVARGLAVDLAPLRVNVVVPGPVDTEAFDMMPKEMLDGFKASMAEKTLVKGMGKPEDVAEAYLYAMKDEYLTGSEVKTHGGFAFL